MTPSEEVAMNIALKYYRSNPEVCRRTYEMLRDTVGEQKIADQALKLAYNELKEVHDG